MKKEEITVRELWQALVSQLLLIVLVTALFGGAAYTYTKLFIPRQYAATAKLCAISKLNREDETEISLTEQTSARRLVETYIVILKSNAVLDEVSRRLKEESGITMGARTISGLMSAESISNTEVFSVTITAKSPKTAQTVVNTLAEVGEKKIVEILDTGDVSIVDLATLPTGPISPNARQNATLGALLGFLLTCIIVIIRSLTNTTIWTEDDLTKHYGIPLLGTIPRLAGQTSESERSSEV